jgi:hypothetical protein
LQVSKNKSKIQPNTVFADTQGQSTPVFAFTYLLGIKLMPRIRNWKGKAPNLRGKANYVFTLSFFLVASQPNPVIGSMDEVLAGAQVAFGGGNGGVAEQQLNLLQLPAGRAAEFGAGAAAMPNPGLCRIDT